MPHNSKVGAEIINLKERGEGGGGGGTRGLVRATGCLRCRPIGGGTNNNPARRGVVAYKGLRLEGSVKPPAPDLAGDHWSPLLPNGTWDFPLPSSLAGQPCPFFG
jgi:hypothetical protein